MEELKKAMAVMKLAIAEGAKVAGGGTVQSQGPVQEEGGEEKVRAFELRKMN